MASIRCSVCDFQCALSSAAHGCTFPRCVAGAKVPKGKVVVGPAPIAGDGHVMVLLYYSYVEIPDVQSAVTWHRLICEHLDIKGRIRVAPEGLNMLLDGSDSALRCYCDAVQTSGVYGLDIDFKISRGFAGKQRFPKLSCKPARHVVEMGTDDTAIGHQAEARHVDPDEWHTLLSGMNNSSGAFDDVVLLDTRNIYESRIGRFECTGVQTLTPDLKHFAQFPGFVDDAVESLRGKRIMMYCTGGVRCDRAASSYILSKNVVKEVLQLKGGICRYLEQFEGQPSFFHGKNFVFDYRRYEPWHDGTVVGRCDGCAEPWDDYDNGAEARCSNCRTLMLVCDKCRSDAIAGKSSLEGDLGNLLCGGDACTGSQICCGCGCGPSCTSGAICRRTGFFTRGSTCREDTKLPGSGGKSNSLKSHCPVHRFPLPLMGCLSELLACLNAKNQSSQLLEPRVRQATVEDCEVCFRVVNEAFTSVYGKPRYRNLPALLEAIRLGHLLVACNADGSVVGCAEHEPLQASGVACFGPIAVSPQCQRSGLGKALMVELEQKATRAGCQTLQLEVRRECDQHRDRLLHFFESQGYKRSGPRKRNYIVLSKFA